ncbi:Alkaline phosphatase synthesis transcriptional regulatory protein PhoP [Geodia barretti]|uniref:Probable transcriptional regulator ycf27 n=1 Tax=Geodia barretti TaxID=519541 RepID=A0AA35W250_GEOBA|nr:Alkaline phosphatase synthesis transcriptional regulatory protein PhoP [Geodia barretti]
MAKVLIVEDDPHTRELVRVYLDREGHDVLTAENGIDGLRVAREEAPDIILLDLMLPGMDGRDVCQSLRGESDVPIVMLTARVQEGDRLEGFDLGADDYITKPFSPREVVARIRAVLRRAARDRQDEERQMGELTIGEVRVDLRNRSVTSGEADVKTTPTEFRLLTLFAKEPGRVFTRDQIIERAFGYDYDGFDRTVDVHVSSLRRKLEATNGGKRIIHTVYGVGYRVSDV